MQLVLVWDFEEELLDFPRLTLVAGILNFGRSHVFRTISYVSFR